MAHTMLADAVDQWVKFTTPLPDTALETPWTWRAHEEGVRFAFFRIFEDLRALAALTKRERAAAGPPMPEAQRSLAQYQVAWRELCAILAPVDDDLLDRVPRAGEWPLRRILGHAFAVPRMFFAHTVHGLNEHRAGRALTGPMGEVALAAFLGHTWDEYDATMGGSLAGILADYARMHDRILTELAPVTISELDAPTLWWEGYEVPVGFRLGRFESHLRQHSIQVEKTLEWLRVPLTEIHRLNRMVYRGLAECEGVLVGAPDFGAAHHFRAAEQINGLRDEIAAALEG